MTLILKDILDIDKVSFKHMDEFKKIIEANVEFYEDNPYMLLVEDKSEQVFNYETDNKYAEIENVKNVPYSVGEVEKIFNNNIKVAWQWVVIVR